jgi:hypothetical protein
MPFSTDDLAAWRAKQLPPEDPAPPERPQPDETAPIRFTLRELLIAVTVVGMLLGILRAAGIFGAVFAFLATAAFTWFVYPKLRPGDTRAQQALFDFLWGVGMPLICLVFDPFIFKENEDILALGMPAKLSVAKIYDLGFIAYAFLGCQMSVMTVWLLLGSKAGPATPLFGGFLASGLMFAALTALVLVVPATIGVLVLGIGLLGLTPLITTFAYGRQCNRALAGIWRSPTEPQLAPLAVLGFFASVIVPVLLGLAILAAVRGPEAVSILFRDG